MRLHAAPVKSVEPHNWGYDFATARRGFPSLTTCDKGFAGKGAAQVFQSYVPADLYAMQITCVVYFNRQ
eukprot:gene2236-1051_t